MYCKRCGYKVDRRDVRCRHCGEELEGLEVCGGFWGLVGKEPEEPVIAAVSVQEPVASVTQETETATVEEKKQRKQKPARQQFPILFRVAIGVCVVCLLALILLFVSIRSNGAALKELQAEINEHKATIDLLQAELDKTEDKLKAAEQQAQSIAQQQPETAAPPVRNGAETEPDAPVVDDETPEAMSEEAATGEPEPVQTPEDGGDTAAEETAAPEERLDTGTAAEEQPGP